MEISNELAGEILNLFEAVRKSGKIRKGINEVTKAIERGNAKFVIYATDVSPAEIIMHLSYICKEKNIPCIQVGKKAELGAIAGIDKSSSAIAITDAGELKEKMKKVIEKVNNS